MKRIVVVVALVLGLIAVAGCGGGEDADVVTVPQDSPFRGGQVQPLQPAPAIDLTSSTGARVSLAAMRGNVVMVTFVYARCPDICPVIVDAMRAAKLLLGDRGERVRLVAVSVDPEQDTPAVVNDFLERHRVAKDVQYVLGSREQLEAVWKAWGVAAQENFDNPALIEHSGVVWILDPDGNRAVYFPVSQITAKDLAHDVGVLLDR